NATAFLDAFGLCVVAWIWLDMAQAAAAGSDADMAQEKTWACRYFYAVEVPKIPGLLAPLSTHQSLTRDVPDHVLV
ncbi:MAG: acyl-CoA dehydrogenase C-terminal domain-containing protein, partial [Thalassovita sp.]